MADSSRIEDLRRRVQKDPASIAFAQLAEECRRAGDLDEAVSVSRVGLALHPTYLSARVTLGRALLELNQLSEAQTELQHVLRSAPENLAALRSLAETLHRQGDLSNSLAQYRVALSLAKNDPDLQETVASLEHQLETAAMASESAAEPQTASAPPEDIFAFLRPDMPAIPEPVAVDSSMAAGAAVEAASAFEIPTIEALTVVETPAAEALTVVETPAVEALTIVEASAAEELPLVESTDAVLTHVESPAVESLAAAEPPLVEEPTLVEAMVETPVVVEAPILNASAESDSVVQAPSTEPDVVDEHLAARPTDEIIEIIETLAPVTTSDLDRLWAEPVPALSGQPHEATLEPESEIQWPMPDDDAFLAAPVAPEPEPVVPLAYRLARERDARTVAVLEQWLQAVHVSRTRRHA